MKILNYVLLFIVFSRSVVSGDFIIWEASCPDERGLKEIIKDVNVDAIDEIPYLAALGDVKEYFPNYDEMSIDNAQMLSATKNLSKRKRKTQKNIPNKKFRGSEQYQCSEPVLGSKKVKNKHLSDKNRENLINYIIENSNNIAAQEKYAVEKFGLDKDAASCLVNHERHKLIISGEIEPINRHLSDEDRMDLINYIIENSSKIAMQEEYAAKKFDLDKPKSKRLIKSERSKLIKEGKIKSLDKIISDKNREDLINYIIENSSKIAMQEEYAVKKFGLDKVAACNLVGHERTKLIKEKKINPIRGKNKLNCEDKKNLTVFIKKNPGKYKLHREKAVYYGVPANKAARYVANIRFSIKKKRHN